MNARIADLIREGRPDEITDAIAEGEFFGMQTFEQALIEARGLRRDRARSRRRRRQQPPRLPRRARARAQASAPSMPHPPRPRPRTTSPSSAASGSRARGLVVKVLEHHADRRIMNAVLAAVVFAPGLAIGSFLNVVASRLPKGISLSTPASTCPHCDTQIRTRDNIPVLSYVLLRGRCHSCKTAIGWRYPAVELGTALLAVGCVVAFGPLDPRARRRDLLRGPRHGLGDRPRAADRPEPGRAARDRCRARPPDGVAPELGWIVAGLGAALFLFVARARLSARPRDGRREARAPARGRRRPVRARSRFSRA